MERLRRLITYARLIREHVPDNAGNAHICEFGTVPRNVLIAAADLGDAIERAKAGPADTAAIAEVERAGAVLDDAFRSNRARTLTRAEVD